MYVYYVIMLSYATDRYSSAVNNCKPCQKDIMHFYYLTISYKTRINISMRSAVIMSFTVMDVDILNHT